MKKSAVGCLRLGLPRPDFSDENSLQCAKGMMLRLVIPSLAYKEALLKAAGEMHACGEWKITPEALEARFDTLLQELPPVHLGLDATASFLNGRVVESSGAAMGRCRVYGAGPRLLGVGEAAAHGELRPVRLVARAETGASG